MTLSELFELSPLAWEEAMRETINYFNLETWKMAVMLDKNVKACFLFFLTENEEMWEQLEYYNDTTLLKQWEAKQIELQHNK